MSTGKRGLENQGTEAKWALEGGTGSLSWAGGTLARRRVGEGHAPHFIAGSGSRLVKVTGA